MSLTKTEIAYVAIILVLVAASLYFLAPALFRTTTQSSGGSIITTQREFPTVSVTILTSASCKSLCNQDAMRLRLQQLLVNVNFTTEYVENASGRQLADRYELTLAPTYLISVPQMDRSPAFPSMRQSLLKLDDDYYLLNTIETKSGVLFRNSQSVNPLLELYISAYEINSLRTANATYSVMQRFRGELNFSVHYVIRKENNSFISNDGYVGLREAVLEVCMHRANVSSFGAQWCRTRQILDCFGPQSLDPAFCAQIWTLCAGSYSLNERNVSVCLAAQNRSILEQEAAATNTIAGVPTIVIGNKYVIAGAVNEFKLLVDICDIYSSRLRGCVVTARG